MLPLSCFPRGHHPQRGLHEPCGPHRVARPCGAHKAMLRAAARPHSAESTHFMAALQHPEALGSDIHVMLILRRSPRQAVVTNKQLDGTDMVCELLGK